VVSDGSGGSIVACYVRGTHIAAPGGEMLVERLRIGDAVLTAAGEVKRVRWIGRRGYGAAYVAAHREARPIRIRAGALSDGVPHRELRVSPEHALLIDGLLVPARHLVNGVSIARCVEDADVAYFHIELEEHDIILAEGAAAETFVDCDSRAMFANAAEFALLYPNDTAKTWVYCAARVEEGEAMADIRRRINLRAGIDDGDWRGGHVPGVLRGNLELVSDQLIRGWAGRLGAGTSGLARGARQRRTDRVCAGERLPHRPRTGGAGQRPARVQRVGAASVGPRRGAAGGRPDETACRGLAPGAAPPHPALSTPPAERELLAKRPSSRRGNPSGRGRSVPGSAPPSAAA
jgi:hypothetical protein